MTIINFRYEMAGQYMFMTNCEKEKVSGSDLIWIIYYHYLFLSTSYVPLQDDPRSP